MKKIVSARLLMVFVFASLFTLLTCGNLLAAAKNDLLLLPAALNSNLNNHFYLDVAKAGNRVVAVGELGVIAYSDDQGQSWKQATVPTSETLTAVYFPTDLQGWAVGHGGVVLHSSDGGQNWEKKLDGNLANTLSLAAAERLYAVAEKNLAEATDESRGDLEITLEDISYQVSDAKFSLEQGPAKPFMDVWFANETEGIVVGAFGMILRTEDAGKSWFTINDSIENIDGFHYYGLAETQKALLLVGEGGIMYRSTDQGHSWETLISPYEGPMFGIGADPAGDTAIAVGLRGKLVVMKDNGSDLELQETLVPVALNASILKSDGRWLLVGLAGQVLQQSEENGTFDLLKLRFSKCMSVVETADGSLILAGLNGIKRIDKSSIK